MMMKTGFKKCFHELMFIKLLALEAVQQLRADNLNAGQTPENHCPMVPSRYTAPPTQTTREYSKSWLLFNMQLQ